MRQSAYSCVCKQALRPAAGRTVTSDNQQLFGKQTLPSLHPARNCTERLLHLVLHCFSIGTSSKLLILMHDTT